MSAKARAMQTFSSLGRPALHAERKERKTGAIVMAERERGGEESELPCSLPLRMRECAVLPAQFVGETSESVIDI